MSVIEELKKRIDIRTKELNEEDSLWHNRKTTLAKLETLQEIKEIIEELEARKPICFHKFHSVCYYNCRQPHCGHTSKSVCEKCNYDPEARNK